VMGLIGARLTQLQVTDVINRQYTEAADENRYDSRLIAPPRGVIYDRFGVPLAITSKDYRVSIIRERAEAASDRGGDGRRLSTEDRARNLEGTIRSVALILGRNEEWVRRKVIFARGERASDKVPLQQGLDWNDFAAVNVRLPELSGIFAESTEVR